MKKMALIKIVIGCLILTSGCGGDKTEATKSEHGSYSNNEVILYEETLVEETILGW